MAYWLGQKYYESPVQLFLNTIARIQFLANIFIFRQSFITPATASKKQLTCRPFLFDTMRGYQASTGNKKPA